MKKFETKAIFFRRPLNEFTSVQEHCSYPLAIFWGFVNKQHSRFQYTPQFGPAFQGTTNLEDKQLQLYLSKSIPKPSPLTKWKLKLKLFISFYFKQNLSGLSKVYPGSSKTIQMYNFNAHSSILSWWILILQIGIHTSRYGKYHNSSETFMNFPIWNILYH